MHSLLMPVALALLVAFAYPAFGDEVLQGKVIQSSGNSVTITLGLKTGKTPGRNAGYVGLGDPYACTLKLLFEKTIEGQTSYVIGRGNRGFCKNLTSGRVTTVFGYNQIHVAVYDSTSTERLAGWVTPVVSEP